MRVEQLMSRHVVTVHSETSFREAVRLLSEHAIGGVPVCDGDGRVLGVLSEGDVVRKAQGIAPGGEMAAWLLEGVDGDAATHTARTAGEAMSSPAVTVAPSAPASEAARLMTEHRIKRLPVVRNGRLVGIVTQADLVRAFCRSDAEIEQELAEDVLVGTLWLPRGQVRVSVGDGVVTLAGEVETRTEAELAHAYARRVPGVVDVASELTWRVDDLTCRTSGERVARGS